MAHEDWEQESRVYFGLGQVARCSLLAGESG